jgi:uncharacterized membrane protein YciS (DUF1049 family)
MILFIIGFIASWIFAGYFLNDDKVDESFNY